jgi:hypothetical protein
MTAHARTGGSRYHAYLAAVRAVFYLRRPVPHHEVIQIHRIARMA